FSEVVLEVKDMRRAVEFWSSKLGYPIVEEWSYGDGQFVNGKGDVWATWLFVGGNSRLGLWLPRNFNHEQLYQKSQPVTSWVGLYDEGGIHVHIALHIKSEDIEKAILVLTKSKIEFKIINEGTERRLYFKDTEDNLVEFYTLD